MRYYLGVFAAVGILAIPWMAYNYPAETKYIFSSIENVGSQLAAVFVSHNPKTVADLQSRYNSSKTSTPAIPVKKVRILLVPGHEPDYGGAEYGDLKERNLTVELAYDLKQFLSTNDRYEVFVTRDARSWSPAFAEYFRTGWNDIVAWQKAHKDEISSLARVGKFRPAAPEVIHQTVPSEVAYRIYGINKWVDENDIDIAIHIHFNDYPGHGRGPGEYSGFTIYVPQKEYDNSPTTKALSGTIFKRLSKYSPTSDLPGESGGVVEDQDLIAVGAYNSVDAASMLIEYGYIYESQFTNESLRATALKDLAFQTYLGLQDFFDPQNIVKLNGSADTLIMPYKWSNPIASTNDKVNSKDVFALQTALLLEGVYPPAKKTKNDCPRTGRIGPCTKTAIELFQKKHGIKGEDGVIGPKTIDLLNQTFGAEVL